MNQRGPQICERWGKNHVYRDSLALELTYIFRLTVLINYILGTTPAIYVEYCVEINGNGHTLLLFYRVLENGLYHLRYEENTPRYMCQKYWFSILNMRCLTLSAWELYWWYYYVYDSNIDLLDESGSYLLLKVFFSFHSLILNRVNYLRCGPISTSISKNAYKIHFSWDTYYTFGKYHEDLRGNPNRFLSNHSPTALLNPEIRLKNPHSWCLNALMSRNRTESVSPLVLNWNGFDAGFGVASQRQTRAGTFWASLH